MTDSKKKYCTAHIANGRIFDCYGKDNEKECSDYKEEIINEQ